MRVFLVDASQWKRPSDVDQALKTALGFPEAGGRGGDVWVDNLIYGNMIDPPCRIDVVNVSNLDETTYYYLMLIQMTVGYARLEKSVRTGVDTDVSISVSA
ncbi:MAG: hypothetical protein IT534_00800 [Bauldia sp.]|nr:hypothetical protein [Bauldia sp.]